MQNLPAYLISKYNKIETKKLRPQWQRSHHPQGKFLIRHISDSQPEIGAVPPGAERGALCERLGQALRSDAYVDFRECQLALVNCSRSWRLAQSCPAHVPRLLLAVLP